MSSLAPITSFTGQYHFLSSFHERSFIFDNREWPTAEHPFQVAKAWPDYTVMEWIRSAHTPGEAKKRGRSVRLRPDWDHIKRQVMMKIQLAKFDQPDLRKQLIATGDAQLIEGNSWGDDYWGCVPSEKRPRIVMPLWGLNQEWAGYNWLGLELMMIKELVR